MTRADLTEKILDIKREKAWTWKHICGEIGGFSPMLIVRALLGQLKLTEPTTGPLLIVPPFRQRRFRNACCSSPARPVNSSTP